jgi:hypothetical protein
MVSRARTRPDGPEARKKASRTTTSATKSMTAAPATSAASYCARETGSRCPPGGARRVRSAAEDPEGQSDARVDPEPPIRVQEMVLDRLLAKSECSGDFLVGQAARDQARYLELAACEAAGR